HLRRMQDTLTQGFQPQAPLERLDRTEDGHQAALSQPGNDLASPRAMAAQARQYTNFHLVPGRFALGGTSRWAKRHHDSIGSEQQGRHFERLPPWLFRRQIALVDVVQLLLELLHGPLPSRLDPDPDRPWTDGRPTDPPQ